ncbi:ATP-binding cassette domain-containing protein [Poseidonibacter lekithochrous]|uniref:ABC transporter ATP-binding protein n=1 Tax=Poseidonibacter TaxID=2321187 RepID=UPI001C08C428|nr:MULTISPECIES: ATP-binding cassette domain-containing protein [Poseidonibacter]MBU3014159.1 ATP-binding cassette domain-containing protein [Poseidonibacter lekithochrous]MDO6827457.1 ATP-binding cassette domain-containing protein [Poseidonibacter sp. 1_MG-2023]
MLDINISSKKYQDNKIIENLKLEVNESEFISIIGPSGCGKTTLLNIISNTDNDFLGSILFDERNIVDSNIGVMFQDSRLIPWLTIFENIMLVSNTKDEELILQSLVEVGLENYIDSYAKELSGGMQRRAALVRAFINKPDVLLLDEPFISLDYPTAQALRSDFLKFYKKYKPTVIFITHDFKEAVSLSNRIIFLDSKPMKIVLDYENKNDFSSNLEDLEIEKIKENILAKYPGILSGSIS